MATLLRRRRVTTAAPSTTLLRRRKVTVVARPIAASTDMAGRVLTWMYQVAPGQEHKPKSHRAQAEIRNYTLNTKHRLKTAQGTSYHKYRAHAEHRTEHKLKPAHSANQNIHRAQAVNEHRAQAKKRTEHNQKTAEDVQHKAISSSGTDIQCSGGARY